MANSNGWGDGAANNNIGWGQGANNAIGWGSVYAVSSAGLTDIIGTTATAPVNTIAPVISGSTPVGSTLTTTNGTWTNSPTFAYQWYRGATLITSATAATYVTVTADTGLAVTCQVTGTNAAGSAVGKSDAITPTAVVTPFAFTANTNNTSAGSSTATQFKLPLTTSTGLNIVVDWGDATTSTITNHLDAAVTHTYASAGTYSISITGTLPGWQFNNTGDRLKILNISSYGVLNITTNSIFRGCTNLISNATDAPTITTTDLSSTFRSCTNFNGNVGNWNVSAVTSMSFMFYNAPAFNQPLSFNTGAVTNMSSMFNNATAFNQPLSFNTVLVNDMSSMFSFALAFNSTLTFNTAAVTNMSNMFSSAIAFNQPLTFTTGAVTNMSSMFQNCTAFNQALSFNTALVNNMSSMFQNATNFNGTLTFTSTALVNTMQSMFSAAFAFNQPLSFNTAAVTNMSGMFTSASAFNQALSFNTAVVTTMSNMFNGASAFNQPLSFNTGAVTTMSSMFNGATAFNQALTFNTALVTTMQSMFNNAVAFNQALTFNTGVVTNMSSMFNNATAFNQNIGAWNVVKVTNFTSFMLGKTNLTFSTANLDAIYSGWSLLAVQPNLNISFGSARFTNAGGLAGKNILLGAPNYWTIADGGGI